MIDNETRRKIIIEYGAGATITSLASRYSLTRKAQSKKFCRIGKVDSFDSIDSAIMVALK